MTVIDLCVGKIAKTAAAVPSKVTLFTLVKLVPTKRTRAPPLVGPEAGATFVMVGRAAAAPAGSATASDVAARQRRRRRDAGTSATGHGSSWRSETILEPAGRTVCALPPSRDL